MRLIDADALKEYMNKPTNPLEEIIYKSVIEFIDNAPTVEERPQGEWIEFKHRLNLLIGVLYSNQCISESDLNYIEDSIKKLIRGGAE